MPDTYLRELPEITLADVAEQLGASTQETFTFSNQTTKVALLDGVVEFTQQNGTREIPASEGTIHALGNWLDIPAKFLTRCPVDLQQRVLSTLLARTPGEGRATYVEDRGITSILDPTQKYIDPTVLVDVLIRTIDKTAQVVEWWSTIDEFRVDVVVPVGFDRGTFGDPEVDDITRGGLRVAQDRKHNLAPTVYQYLLRLACTNGMEIVDPSMSQVDARGNSVEELLDDFEVLADRAFSEVEGKIKAFYDLRGHRLNAPERTLLRVGSEHHLPLRSIHTMEEMVPLILDDDGGTNMFDLVNLITNSANGPGVRSGVRRKLERVGGALVTEHVVRCDHCQSKLVTG